MWVFTQTFYVDKPIADICMMKIPLAAPVVIRMDAIGVGEVCTALSYFSKQNTDN